MKKSILNLGKTLNKTEQQSINGGRLNPFDQCRYRCNGRNLVLVAGSSTYCLLNFPAIIPNSPSCGGSGDGPGPIYA